MAELNHKVENDKEEPAKVAHDYLVERNFEEMIEYKMSANFTETATLSNN